MLVEERRRGRAAFREHSRTHKPGMDPGERDARGEKVSPLKSTGNYILGFIFKQFFVP